LAIARRENFLLVFLVVIGATPFNISDIQFTNYSSVWLRDIVIDLAARLVEACAFPEKNGKNNAAH
jgi:hypothetical protein